MILFDHPANQIDQVDSKTKDKEGESYQQPIFFRSGSRQVSISVEEALSLIEVTRAAKI